MIRLPGIRVNENLHIALWLVKDLAWLMEYRITGLTMVPPTILMACFIAWQCRADRRELIHAIAVILWILANSTWMIGDFFFEERGHGLARAFFLSGLTLLGVYYLVILPMALRRNRNTTVTNA